jgi:hypothetical protein
MMETVAFMVGSYTACGLACAWEGSRAKPQAGKKKIP